MFLNAKTKGGDAVEQPEGLDHKLLVFKEEVTVTGGIQGDGPSWSLLWVQRTTLLCYLEKMGQENKHSGKNNKKER